MAPGTSGVPESPRRCRVYGGRPPRRPNRPGPGAPPAAAAARPVRPPTCAPGLRRRLGLALKGSVGRLKLRAAAAAALCVAPAGRARSPRRYGPRPRRGDSGGEVGAPAAPRPRAAAAAPPPPGPARAGGVGGSGEGRASNRIRAAGEALRRDAGGARTGPSRLPRPGRGGPCPVGSCLRPRSGGDEAVGDLRRASRQRGCASYPRLPDPSPALGLSSPAADARGPLRD